MEPVLVPKLQLGNEYAPQRLQPQPYTGVLPGGLR
jgi:hypothetical protein